MSGDETQPSLLASVHDYPRHALRIPPGWLVKYNEFYEVPADHPEAWSFACRGSLVMLSHPMRGVLVDLGWVPDEDPTGGYLLRVFEGDHLGRELQAFETRERATVIAKMERVLNDITSFRFSPLGDNSQ